MSTTEEPTAPYDGIVEKKVFEMAGPYQTVGGASIRQVRVGYETIGRLNANRDNAILIPHYNSGTSHFAGRYKPDDPLPGYWDAIVGPGKPLDTDKYFLIGVDSLCNVNAGDGITVTTGPASIDPGTGRPYGIRFPLVQIRDFVNVQKAVVEHLGITRLHAVMGASMGSMQTYEWAAAFPEMVDRIIAVIPCSFVDDYAILKLRSMRQSIMLDPAWHGGDYYGGPEPSAGLTLALTQMTMFSLAPEWGEQTFNRRWAEPSRDPAQDMSSGYASSAWIDSLVAARIPMLDANHFLYIQKANELFTLGGQPTLESGLELIKAKALLIPSANDNILYAEQTRKTRDILLSQGKQVGYFELTGPYGHLNGLLGIAQAGEAITRFLE